MKPNTIQSQKPEDLTCDTCHEGSAIIIKGQYVTIREVEWFPSSNYRPKGNYHPDCIPCDRCNKTRYGEHLFKFPEGTYHLDCRPCDICKTIIKEKGVFENTSYDLSRVIFSHADCPQCSVCKEPENGTVHRYADGFFHHKCRPENMKKIGSDATDIVAPDYEIDNDILTVEI